MALIAIEKLIKHVGCGTVDDMRCCVLCEQIRERLKSLAPSVSHQPVDAPIAPVVVNSQQEPPKEPTQ